MPDFGILVLEENVDIENNRYVKIAHLPWPNEKPPTGRRLVVSGWGDDYNVYNKPFLGNMTGGRVACSYKMPTLAPGIFWTHSHLCSLWSGTE